MAANIVQELYSAITPYKWAFIAIAFASVAGLIAYNNRR